MKIIFSVKDKDTIETIFSNMADHFKTDVYADDYGCSYIISKPDKLQIAQKEVKGEDQVYVWGANEKQLVYFKSVLGAPLKIIEEKLSPVDFAKELANIPDIENRTKAEIMQLMDINEADLKRYKKLIGYACRKPNAEKELLLTKEILEKF